MYNNIAICLWLKNGRCAQPSWNIFFRYYKATKRILTIIDVISDITGISYNHKT